MTPAAALVSNAPICVGTGTAHKGSVFASLGIAAPTSPAAGPLKAVRLWSSSTPRSESPPCNSLRFSQASAWPVLVKSNRHWQSMYPWGRSRHGDAPRRPNMRFTCGQASLRSRTAGLRCRRPQPFHLFRGNPPRHCPRYRRYRSAARCRRCHRSRVMLSKIGTFPCGRRGSSYGKPPPNKFRPR